MMKGKRTNKQQTNNKDKKQTINNKQKTKNKQTTNKNDSTVYKGSCLRKRAEDICLEEEIMNQEFVRLEDVF